MSLRSDPQATNRVVEHFDVEVPCASWRATVGNFPCDDETAAYHDR